MCQKEIGSEFWSVELSNKNNLVFDENTSWYLSGRVALKAIIQELKTKSKVKSVAMPSWCCESMLEPFFDCGVEVSFYPVYFQNGQLKQEIITDKKTDVLFLVDYFGYEQKQDHCFDGHIIRDVTHSVFSKKRNDANYYFGSLRKWSGFLTGGFAFGDILPKESQKNIEYANLRRTAMLQKKEYIEKGIGDKSFLSVFATAEGLLDNSGIYGADTTDIASAKSFDVDFVKKRRRENATFLLEHLSEFAIFDKLGEEDCPLFFPILLPEDKRNDLRAFLIERKIYCPIHWPLSKKHLIGKREESLYNQELSLLCDQRYGLEDMEKIVKAVKTFFKR